MFEYNEKMKINTLNFWGFDLQNLNVNKICHVPMHQYRIATKEQPLLYVDNLQCCIGLYAYSNTFGFAAHINPVVMRGDEYELNDSGIAIRFNRINDLKNAILKHDNYEEKIKIGISLGWSPLDKEYPTVKMIHESINNLIMELTLMGFNVQKLEEKYEPQFIIDIENQEFIVVENEKNKIK